MRQIAIRINQTKRTERSDFARCVVVWCRRSILAEQLSDNPVGAKPLGAVCQMRASPATPPRILANYLKDPRDRDLLRKGIRIVREIVNQPAFKPFCGEEIYPGNATQSDSELDVCIEEKLNTQWHLSGTARMGARNNREAVVEPNGLVHGISKLRIVDASIMPAATNGNTNSPTIMIAEKLSDSVLGKPPLDRLEVPVWQNKNYETCQR